MLKFCIAISSNEYAREYGDYEILHKQCCFLKPRHENQRVVASACCKCFLERVFCSRWKFSSAFKKFFLTHRKPSALISCKPWFASILKQILKGWRGIACSEPKTQRSKSCNKNSKKHSSVRRFSRRPFWLYASFDSLNKIILRIRFSFVSNKRRFFLILWLIFIFHPHNWGFLHCQMFTFGRTM